MAILEVVLCAVLLSAVSFSLSQSAYTASAHLNYGTLKAHDAVFDLGALLAGNTTARSCIMDGSCATGLLASMDSHYGLQYSSVSYNGLKVYSGDGNLCRQYVSECFPGYGAFQVYCIEACN